MIRERLTATWVVTPDPPREGSLDAWALGVNASTAFAMVQVGPGRGKLASGFGALVLADGAYAGDQVERRWWSDSFHAEFALRQVNAPSEEPDPTATRYMLVTRTYVPAVMRNQFRQWLEEEHSQRQLDVPGNNWYLGYEEVGDHHSFMNFWGLSAPDIAEGEAWDRARLTPWRERMRPAMAAMDRGIYRTAVG